MGAKTTTRKARTGDGPAHQNQRMQVKADAHFVNSRSVLQSQAHRVHNECVNKIKRMATGHTHMQVLSLLVAHADNRLR